jgi:hypothetical protein
MNHLDAALAARAFRCGRALRSASRRHRRLVPRPLAVVLFQLGAEQFSAAALGWGERVDRMEMAVAGEPRNPDLAFAALLRFARWFNPRFEAHGADRETFTRGESRFTRARSAPQVLVANAATVEMLGRLGRRLAYLSTEGPRAADPALVRLGRHLRFLWDHWATAGQQLLVCLTDLLNDHWASPLSPLEGQSLAALDAYIQPAPGQHGFNAAAAAEGLSVGPVPAGAEDETLKPLVERFNERRGGSTAPKVVGPLLGPIEAHYCRLVEGAWRLLWRCRDREAALPEARSVGRRWDEDRDAYTRHLDWLARSGLRRTRQTPRQAAMTLCDLEEAARLVEAEEACDDPLRMIPALLQHKAVRGRVAAVDLEHRERATKAMVRRPLVTLLSPDPCLIPTGRELWWSEQPDGREFVVEAVATAPRGGWLVTLKLMTSSATTGLPTVGSEACFSVHNTKPGWLTKLPHDEPWTHQPSRPPAAPAPIEEEGD